MAIAETDGEVDKVLEAIAAFWGCVWKNHFLEPPPLCFCFWWWWRWTEQCPSADFLVAKTAKDAVN